MSCIHCGDGGWLLIEEVIALDDLTEDETPPYWEECGMCET